MIRGKAALRDYFRGGLETAGANIRFTLLDVLVGVTGYTIYYSRESGATVVGTAVVNGAGKALRVHAHIMSPNHPLQRTRRRRRAAAT